MLQEMLYFRAFSGYQQNVSPNECLTHSWFFSVCLVLYVPFSLTVLEDVIWLPGPPPIPPFSFVCVEFFHPGLFLPPSLCIKQPPTHSAQKRLVQLWGACHHYTSSQQGGDSAATLRGWDVSPSEWWHFQMFGSGVEEKGGVGLWKDIGEHQHFR